MRYFLVKMKLSLAVRLLHCIVISSLSHYRNVLFPGEDKAVSCRKIVAINSLSAVHSCELYHIHIMSFSSYKG